MASNSECAEATQVLLVDPQSLPVLLHRNSERNGGDITVDLLQQALQGTSAIDDGDDGDPAEEVNLDALSGGNTDVVAIYQGEEGQTHTIKISLAEAQSLGLQLNSNDFNGAMADSIKVASVGDQLVNDNSGVLNNTSLLQSVACSNVATDGRIIDEEGNIVETTETLQILPSSLSSFLDDGMNQSLSIVPQYELDGTVTYAVKLKNPNESVLGTNYHVLEPNSSAKTGLDIEEELRNSNLKQNILHSAETITAESLGLTSSVTLNDTANSASSTIQVPISTLEALSKQMLLPVSSSSIPISVTLTIPTDTSIPSHTGNVSTSNLASPNTSRFYQIVTDRCSVGLNNVLAADATPVSLASIVSQPTLTINQQHPHLIAPSSTMLNVQNPSTVTLLANNRGATHPTSRHQIISDKLPSLLAAPKAMPGTALKTVTALKKLPISANIVTPTAVSSSIVHSPAMASIAPNTSQPNLGGATISKPCGRLSQITSNSSKPLGSSENPIQLVQQGQTFHSMQALNQAQLRQIATVLQQKNLNSNSTASKNVLFDEQTKTRIVYRVVYPEDVDLQQPPSPSGVSSGNRTSKLAIRPKGRAGRPKNKRRSKKSEVEKYTKNVESDVTQDSTATDTKRGETREDLVSKEEPPRVEKKKVLGSRTRSGRMSRPPRHMMKDFKHLHHTDYKDKDGDDSDGYSDYSNPEQPPEKPPVKEVELDVSPVQRKSRFSCPTCKKLYLGLRRMETHFQKHPEHGSFEEFKQQLAASTPAESVSSRAEASGDKEMKMPSAKANLVRGKKRSQGSSQSEKERSEIRKKKLKQALQACEMSEVLEVAGPLIARYYTLWDLLLLRLVARDESCRDGETSGKVAQSSERTSIQPDGSFDLQELSSIDESGNNFITKSQNLRSTSNRVQWLLLELSSLAETLHSLAGDLLHPALMHSNEEAQIEINHKTVCDMLGVSCGTYSVNEEHLSKRIESFTMGSKETMDDNLDIAPEKRSRKLDDSEELSLAMNHRDSEVCSGSLSTLSLMVKPVDTDKAILAKLTEDMPFLNSSDDMICGTDPDLSTDSKRDQDCDPATGVQVVDDIVNERLTNLSDNMNFTVPLQGALASSDISVGQSELHLISSFDSADAPISVSNSSVIPSSLSESNKPSSNVSNMDLISSYSISSLSRPGAHDVNISSSEPTNDLASALEPVTSQSMLSGFSIGLSFDALQSQSSNVPHSEDSFLESLGSFETPLSQACGSSNATGSSFEDSVMKSGSMLQLTNEPSQSARLPPKFISSFTPAITNEKSSPSISTAQRLQRSYLELDSGLDDGLDLDFEAFTQELSMNRNSSA